ncbi:phosphatidylglycerophosphatase A family protein [Thermocrinis sp.]
MNWELVATGFYVGRIRYAPGTVGTLLGVPLAYLFGFKWWLVLLVGVSFYFLALKSVEYMIGITRERDPEEVVIDEVLGYLFCFLLVEPTLKALVLAFFLFRTLDILKPFPISLFERLPGAHGVIADDVVAGLLTGFILYIILSGG